MACTCGFLAFEGIAERDTESGWKGG
jgi:hypothetical protein